MRKTSVVTFGPNPTNGQVILYFNDGSKRQLALYNAAGTLIWTKTISAADAEIEMQQFPAGMYLMKVGQEKGTQTLRIVKE